MPFIRERDRWYQQEKKRAKLLIDVPTCLFFHWSYGRLDRSGGLGRIATLEDILTNLLRLKSLEYGGANVTRQTGLQFRIEKQPAPMWLVVEEPGD